MACLEVCPRQNLVSLKLNKAKHIKPTVLSAPDLGTSKSLNEPCTPLYTKVF